MKTKGLTLAALAASLIVAVSAAALAGSGYESLYGGWVDDNATRQASNCFVTFGISNGSYVHVSVQSPDYPAADAYIPPGNSYYYYDALRVYVAEVNNNTGQALVDISKPASSGSSSSSGTKIWCDAPGQRALGGDAVTFPVTLQNNNAVDKTYTLSASSNTGWGLSFQYGGKDVYQLYVPAAQARTVNLVAQTAYNSPIGEKTISISTGDAGMELRVYITSVNQSASVAVQVSSLIVGIGDKAYYSFSVQNLQSQQNNYKLAVEGLPENWYYQYLDSQASTSRMAEVVVPSQATKGFVLQILPPVSVTEGEYGFTAAITTPDNVTIRQPLTLRLTSAVSMTVNQDKLAYTSQPGETFDFKVYVSNTGSGGALTNVYPDITAPTGWIVSASPARVNSLKAGETQVFTVSVQSPGNIVASDYDVNINVKSDQAQSAKDYRITIETSSIIPYIGVGVIVVVLVGLVFLFVEVLKSTRTSQAAIFDHILSTLVLIVFLIEFIAVKGAGTSTFFILALMSLFDVIAGFTVTITTARRDVTMDRDSGFVPPAPRG